MIISKKNSLVLVLLLATLGSALALVTVRQLNRVSFYELQKLERNRDALAIEWRQLMAEYSTWRLEHSVETEVRGERNMRPPLSAKIQTIELARRASEAAQ